MSIIHILEKDPDNKTINCIFHIPVPVTNNLVGMLWSEVIKKAYNPVPLMSYNDATENINITEGTVLEKAYTVRFTSTNLTNAQRLTQIQTTYDIQKVEIFNKLEGTLDFFGKEI